MLESWASSERLRLGTVAVLARDDSDALRISTPDGAPRSTWSEPPPLDGGPRAVLRVPSEIAAGLAARGSAVAVLAQPRNALAIARELRDTRGDVETRKGVGRQ